MPLKECLAVVSVLKAFVSFTPYIRDMVAGRTKPHAFSWIVWALVAAIAFVAARSDDAGAGAWTMGFGAVVYAGIAIFSLFRGEKTVTTSDIVFFVGALGAIPLWFVTGDPLGSVLLVSAIDVAGFYPTFRKSYAKPHEETAFMYGADSLRFLLSLFALDHYSTVTVLAPLVSFVMDVAFVSMLVWRRRVLAQSVVR